MRALSLGIESTAHTFGAAVVSFDGRIASNVRDVYVTETGGIVPARAAEHHVAVCGDVIAKALHDSKVRPAQLSLITYSQSPGLGHCLRIGAMTARALAALLRKPILGVNHCIAHLEIGRLVTGAKDPVMLYASGANTQIIAFEASRYRVFGETLDMGAGNFIDSFARHLGLGFPGGPAIAELAAKGKKLIPLPYSVKGMDVAFSGLLTNLQQKADSGRYSKEDLAFSLQEYTFAMLIEVAERAMAHTRKDELLLAGGVCCNARLQEMAKVMCAERGARCYIPPNDLLVDNAAMIAWQGILEHNAGRRAKLEEADVRPYVRTDEIDVIWRKER